MSAIHPFPGFHLHSTLVAGMSLEAVDYPTSLSHEAPFNRLALQVFQSQFENNPPYNKWCNHLGMIPGVVKHWTQVPAVPTSTFKEYDWSCIPPAERTAVFYSSGTTAQRPSRHHHHARSLELYRTSLIHGFLRLSWVQSLERVRSLNPLILSLTPPVTSAPHSSLVHMFETWRELFSRPGSAFAGKISAPGEWIVDVSLVQKALEQAEKESRPVWIWGTAFNWVHACDAMSESGRHFQVLPGSMALETGGYKGRSRILSRTELHQSIAHLLGLDPAQLISEYGMSELSSQGYTRLGDPRPCYMFPPWMRVRVVSPESGVEVGLDQTGMLQVLDLANLYSVSAVITEDLAIRRSDGIELVGRVSQAEPRGCSIMSSDRSPL